MTPGARPRAHAVLATALSLTLAIPPGAWSEETAQIVHVLNRLGYGPRPGDVEAVRRIGLDAWIDRQLHPERIPEPALEPRLAGLPTLRLGVAELYRGYEIPREARREIQQRRAQMGDDASEAERQKARRELMAKYAGQMKGLPRQVVEELQQAKVLRAVYGERQLDEVLVDFWMNHFNVYAAKGPEEFLVGAYERDVIRPHEFLKKTEAARHAPAGGAVYPRGRYGDSLRQIAQLLKADAGVEVAFTEIGGWDHHAAEGGVQGQLAIRLREFGQALAAFHRDMGDRMRDVVVVSLTEFGRTVRENGNRGTDHGHASVSFVMGGGVKGARVQGRWPGLDMDALHEGRDLAVTTDFRDLLAELLTAHLGARDLRRVFPGYAAGPPKFPGVMRV